MVHECKREREINTLFIEYKNMSDKIDKIELKVDKVFVNIEEVKELIMQGQIEYHKDKAYQTQDIKDWGENTFASKNIERLVYWIVTIILVSIITEILHLVIK